MSIELSGAGETLTAIVVSNELSDGNHGDGLHGKGTETNCANCGATLQGKYCHACGQSAHIHRSLLHMFEEALHGLFHFDTKAWRTIPALIFHPGKLTKEYIEGKRTSYVSPLALFLFLIFLMFFVFSFTAKEMESEILKTTDTREEIVQEMANLNAAIAKSETDNSKPEDANDSGFQQVIDRHEKQGELRALQDKLDKIDGKPKTIAQYREELSTAEAQLATLKQEQKKLQDAAETSPGDQLKSIIKQEQLISLVESDIKYFKKKIAKLEKADQSKSEGQKDQAASKSASSNDASAKGASIDAELDDSNAPPWVKNMVAHVETNKALTLYKMKKNASSYAFLLMPISLPFLWMLFMFRRQFVMFDHAVFSLYSLSFMCILLMLIAILARFEFVAISSMLFVFVPPIHMFKQLRGAYSLGFLAAFWRTIALLFIAALSLSLYAALITLLSAK